MPPTGEPVRQEKSLDEVVESVGLYPADAYHFVEQGLGYTVLKIHGEKKSAKTSRHVSGQQLCEGLREFALKRWGLMARAVLARWNVTSTLDFGRIVFAMIDGGRMSKTDEDDIDDFKDVFDFRTAFETGYRIEIKS